MTGTVPPLKILAGKAVTGPVSARITIDGKRYLNFFGAGYLALSGLPEIRRAVSRALEQGVPFAQHLPPAHGALDPIFDAVERAAAVTCGTESSVYFASGYLIGSVGLAGLAGAFDLIALDESAHYSLRDAAKLCGVPTFTFAHCDVESLSDELKRKVVPGQRPLVVTDGVFPTSGEVAPLAEYAAILEPHRGRLFVDESHAFGVVGANGRGAIEHCGVEPLATSGATLSKAFCAQGAVMGCSAATAARLRAIPPIGAACAGSPLSAVAASASLAYVSSHPELRSQLREMTDYLRLRLRSLALEIIDSPAPIVSFQWGTRTDMQALQRRAFERGIYIHYSTYIGAGPEGTIRCAVFRDHSREDIDTLVEALR